MAKNLFKDLDCKIVIISRGRASSITSHKVFPKWVEVVVPSSEELLYRESIDNDLILCPDDIRGMGAIRNYCINTFKENIVIMIDDDITCFYCNTGEKTRRCCADEIEDILFNIVVMSSDLGVSFFGFSQMAINMCNQLEPFTFNRMIGCVVGVIGKDKKFADDKSKVDIDFTMQCLLLDRIVWIDSRYLPMQKKDNNIGGCSLYRKRDTENHNKELLVKKWGSLLSFTGSNKNVSRSVKINVKRRQRLYYE